MTNTPLEQRVRTWYLYGYNIKRILLHPDDREEAQKLWKNGTYGGLPIEYLPE